MVRKMIGALLLTAVLSGAALAGNMQNGVAASGETLPATSRMTPGRPATSE
jgi:hypothetical protein